MPQMGGGVFFSGGGGGGFMEYNFLYQILFISVPDVML